MEKLDQGIILPSYTCLRCGHTWNPRTNVKPRWCPKPSCHSPYWDSPRKQKKEIKA